MIAFPNNTNPRRLGLRQQRAAKLRVEAEARLRHTRQTQRDATGSVIVGFPGARGSDSIDQSPGDVQAMPEPESTDTSYRGNGPTGEGEHVVREGECISSIAYNAGHCWETIWDEPGNADLRETRGSPNVLLPGDRVVVPPVRRKDEPCKTEMRHRFQRRGQAVLRLVLKDEDVPRANEPYTLTVDGRQLSGVTDAEGKLECPISPNAQTATLGIGENKQEYELRLGAIGPVDELIGVKQRLSNLGYPCGDLSEALDDDTRRGLKEFQRKHELDQTGEPDSATRSSLRQAHGS